MININLNEKYLIVADLDGTLVNQKAELSPLTIKVVKYLTRKGHIFIPITGRPPEGSYKLYKQLNLQHLMVNFNGSYIWYPNHENVFKTIELSFNYHVVHDLLKSSKINRYVENFIIETSNGRFMKFISKNARERAAIFRRFHVSNKNEITIANRDLSNIKSDVHSFLIQIKNDRYINDLMREIRYLNDTLYTRVWIEKVFGTVVEINSRYATKGSALLYLSSYYGINLEHCISFGDGDNDAEMLKKSGLSFAMSNATMTAKLNSRHITKYSYDQDGVAKELIRLFKIRIGDL